MEVFTLEKKRSSTTNLESLKSIGITKTKILQF